MVPPDVSRRLAAAIANGAPSIAQRDGIASAATKADSWEKLPQWVRDFVGEAEASQKR